MKKLMVSTIILLPLLILAIMLVSGAIISLVTHIYVESVEFVQPEALMLVMTDEATPPEERLEVTVLPLKAENRELLFSMEDESIATVDENGVVKAKFYGETYITVTSEENKAATAKRKVIVTDSRVHALTLNGEIKTDLYEGETQALSVTVYPKEAERKAVTWTSSDESILVVSANGTVTSVGAGTATVTATSDDNGEAQDSVQITCHKKLNDLETNRNSVVTSLAELAFPAVTPVPADADVTYAYKTSDPAIATVDARGNITFLKEGRVTVTVTATDFGGKTVEKQKDYTSTNGYFLPPLFAQKQYTFDYDEYKDTNRALPIPFAEVLEGSFRKFVGVEYDVANVLDFDETTREFRFQGPMPVGRTALHATVTAEIYDIDSGEIIEYIDEFTLNVLRNAKSVAVAYQKTEDAAVITTAQKTLTFGTGRSGAAYATVAVSPANHTNAVSYTLSDGAASMTKDGVLTFTGEGEANVTISLTAADGHVTATKDVRVIYAPVEENEKGFEIGTDKPQQQNFLLSMNETEKEEGILFFTEPADARTDYSVEAGKDVVTLVADDSGAWRIVPQKGGFATVKITVTPDQAPRAFAMTANETVEYTFEVYIDRPVTAADLTAKLDGESRGEVYGTSAASVAFAAEIAERDGSMAGKQIYIKYADTTQTGQESEKVFAGTIPFTAQGTLAVTFGVEYGEKAKNFGAKSEALASVTKAYTLTRDANEIRVTYGETEPSEITVHEKTFNFSTGDNSGAFAKVTVLPADYTGTVKYELTSGVDAASVTQAGVLTFTQDGTATVRITVVSAANGAVTAEKTVSVTYAYVAPTDKTVDVEHEPDPKVLLTIDDRGAAQKAAILLTVPSGQTATYTVESGAGVVTLDEQHRIVPQKGGFATVKIALTDASGETQTEYSIAVYVDLTVDVNALAVEFANTPCQNDYYTSENAVKFTVRAENGKGEVAGKRLFVKYGNETQKGDAGDATFAGEIDFADLGELAVTFGVEYDEAAKEYGAEHSYNTVSRRILRNATGATVRYRGVQTQKILTQNQTVRFGTSASDDAVITAIPSNHKNVLSYVLTDEKSIATLTAGVLTFREAGSVTVTVTYKTAAGTTTVQKEITVIYAPAAKAETAINVGEGETKALLKLGDGATEGVIYYTEPESETVDYTVEVGKDVVELEKKNGVWHIIPQKGGFATVKIAGNTARTVSVYVDKPVTEADFAVYFNENAVTGAFVTSFNSVEYRVELTDRDGSAAGKTLYASYNTGSANKDTANGTTLTKSISNLPNTLTVTFGVEYGAAAKEHGAAGDLSSVQRTVQSTHGDLTDLPTVTAEEEAGGSRTLNAQDALTFANIGDTITLTVGKNFSPADFVLTDEKIKMDGTAYVGVAIKDGVITLTAKDPCTSDAMSLSIGSKTFTLTVTVYVKAETVEVKFGETPLKSGQEYQTLLSVLTLNVTLARADGKPITDRTVCYTDGSGQEKTAQSGDITVRIEGLQEPYQIIFKAKDGIETAEFVLEIRQVPLADFGVKAFVDINGGQRQDLDETHSAIEKNVLSCPLPNAALGIFTLKFTISDDFLGGIGTEIEFKNIFTLDLGDSSLEWSVESYNVITYEIVVKYGSGDFNNIITVTGGVNSVMLQISHVEIQGIAFTGFDSGNKANGGDVYKGFQQVRVFAKQSTYKGVDVDYFRMPVKAYKKMNGESGELANLSNLSWKLTRQNDKDKSTTEIASQVGNTVTYSDGNTYSVVETADGKYELQDEGGQTVVNADGKYTGSTHVTWVDAFSEAASGYVRIYFGDFAGLSETDVQNDYFGNFAEETSWSKPTDAEMIGITGEKVNPSINAFSYLRIEGGDGAQNGVNCHFNFNVLEGTDLYNVQDATSYYLKKKIVLQADLYGDTELDSVPELKTKMKANDQILDIVLGHRSASSPDTLANKTVIYGNGNQINLNVLNTMIKTSGKTEDGGYMYHDGKENTGHGTSFGNLYNVTLKGRNDDTKVVSTEFTILFNISNIYYSNLQNYSKLQRTGTICIKNSVLSNVSMQAIQLWNDTNSKDTVSTVYLENVTMVNVMKGISLEGWKATDGSMHTVYIKGFFDVLNYSSLSRFKGVVPDAFQSMIGKELVNTNGAGKLFYYAEWFGNTVDEQVTADSTDVFVHSIVLDTTLYGRNGDVKSWSDDNYVNATNYNNNGVKLASIKMVDGILSAYTYYPQNSTDGGKTTPGYVQQSYDNYWGYATYERTNPKKLFTEDRYIRLLCEYLDIDDTTGEPIQNTEHILWHMQKCYRNINLIGNRTEDHITALKESIQNAINSQKWDGVWPDGSTLQQALDACPEAAVLAEMISQTVLPAKEEW